MSQLEFSDSFHVHGDDDDEDDGGEEADDDDDVHDERCHSQSSPIVSMSRSSTGGEGYDMMTIGWWFITIYGGVLPYMVMEVYDHIW